MKAVVNFPLLVEIMVYKIIKKHQWYKSNIISCFDTEKCSLEISKLNSK
jgi:hypothetical protein